MSKESTLWENRKQHKWPLINNQSMVMSNFTGKRPPALESKVLEKSHSEGNIDKRPASKKCPVQMSSSVNKCLLHMLWVMSVSILEMLVQIPCSGERISSTSLASCNWTREWTNPVWITRANPPVLLLAFLSFEVILVTPRTFPLRLLQGLMSNAMLLEASKIHKHGLTSFSRTEHISLLPTCLQVFSQRPAR